MNFLKISVTLSILIIFYVFGYLLYKKNHKKNTVTQWVTLSSGKDNCSKVCGGGQRFMSVKCEDANGNTLDNSLCDADKKPPTVESCNEQKCEWTRKLTTPCPTCGTGQHSSEYAVSCPTGKDEDCDNKNKPSTQESCKIDPCAWNYNNWEPENCPTCWDGKNNVYQTRTATCSVDDPKQCGGKKDDKKLCTINKVCSWVTNPVVLEGTWTSNTVKYDTDKQDLGVKFVLVFYKDENSNLKLKFGGIDNQEPAEPVSEYDEVTMFSITNMINKVLLVPDPTNPNSGFIFQNFSNNKLQMQMQMDGTKKIVIFTKNQ